MLFLPVLPVLPVLPILPTCDISSNVPSSPFVYVAAVIVVLMRGEHSKL